MTIFLGVDGGGTKTAFILIDDAGRVLASHNAGPAYHPEVGIEGVRSVLSAGCEAIARASRINTRDVDFAFFGIPAYGEDSRLQPELDALPSHIMPAARYRCGNDMVCAWAGALAGGDGINIVAGTGSIAYGEYLGLQARAGGWGELFGDEGSAYWLAREGLTLFAAMSDGRQPRGPLYEVFREHFDLRDDLDLCAAIYGENPTQRSELARLSELVSKAAAAGDLCARDIFRRGAIELAAMVKAVRRKLEVPGEVELAVSYSGSLFSLQELYLLPLQAKLERGTGAYRLVPPQLPPSAGAALYAGRLCGQPLTGDAVARLTNELNRAG
jgi:N-acetylglucosamine kinase-like BadF-type ATPase